MGNKLEFNITGDDNSTIDFMVVSFEGYEAISESYEFKIQLRCKSIIDVASVLGKHGIFTIKIAHNVNCKPQVSTYHGIITKVKSVKKSKNDDTYYYQVSLAPKFTNLKYSKKSDVFIQSGLEEILSSVFQDHMFTAQEQKMILSYDALNYMCTENVYNRYSYVCQYEESDYDFINRLLERDGVYYYFEQGKNQEQVIITDTKDCYSKRFEGSLHFRARNDQTVGIDPNAIDEIELDYQLIPKTITIKNFCYQKADKGEDQDGIITVSKDVNPGSEEETGFIGEEVIYGENFINADQGINGDGEFLARIRAEEIYCRRLVYKAKSSALPITAGMRITIDSDDKSFTGDYLVVKVLHEGHYQVHESATDTSSQIFYRNILTLIPAKVQFRPQRKTLWPRIYGTMTAFIDGDADNGVGITKSDTKPDVTINKELAPQLNEFGCYKIRLPFLKYPKVPGKGSVWVRLATPYAGDGYGLHFPLYKGTEVLLSFRNGDPDLPVIMAALFNSTHQNILNSKSACNGGGIITRKTSISFNDTVKKISLWSDGNLHSL